MNVSSDSELTLELSDSYKTSKVKDYVSQFILSDETMVDVKQLLEHEMNYGLKDPNSDMQGTSMEMRVTFFTELFNGFEKGDYVIIFLDKRYLVLALVKISPGFSPETKTQVYPLSENVKKTPYIKIFEYISDCLLEFFTELNLLEETQVVGFCCNLPVVQLGIDDCTICYFTSEASNFPLNCYDIHRCFNIVLRKPKYKNLKFDLAAILSNNTSSFISTAYIHGNIDMLVNFEDDCNILYWEDRKLVEKWRKSESNEGKVLIDCDLKNFGKLGTIDFISTNHDWDIIPEHLNDNYEKHCSMGQLLLPNSVLELIKRILLSLHHDLLYCRTANIESLQSKGVSLTDVINLVNNKNDDQALVLLPGGTVCGTVDDAKIACYVIDIILKRTAQLKSICLAAFMSKFASNDLVVIIKSSLFWQYLEYEADIRNIIQKLLPKKKFQFFRPSNFANYEGAALATSIAVRMDKKELHF
ncbi:hexokinase HKDC1-like [Parasteatoda tepidariorum]|uniref:hexokinase HKDC1-like n=1 Tax=Parasteatoda tepidariorum TaxID=114398 RepID=UPI00077FD151|nr:hexokinase HKDC1-like [Parasteatoda tepidariorum]